MKYMITWQLSQATFRDAVARFLQTGGLPPAGVTMLGRWHGISCDTGVIIAESNDPAAIYEWIAAWSDLVPLQATQVIEDQAAAGVLKKLYG